MLPPIIEFLKDKSVLILGFGREGKSTYNYIRRYLPEKKLTVADGKEQNTDDENVAVVCGENYLDCLGGFDVVIKSPGISFAEVEIPENTFVTCQTDLFLKYAPCKKVGVTGTKGKTTTSTLIYKMLRAGNADCVLMGNMGLPVLDYIDEMTGDKTAVIELSSHQLEFTHSSPQVAVITNIYEEHLEHYKGGMNGYVNAKLNIVRYQGKDDTFIYNGSQGVDRFINPEEIKSRKIAVSEEDKLPFTLDNPRLKGRHNRHDVLFALAAARLFNVSDQHAAEAAADFEGIEHRMEPVGEYRGISFYNDCIATVPRAVMCSVEALSPQTLIIGGLDRGIDYTDFAADLENSGVEVIIGTKTTGHKIIDMMLSAGTKKQLVKAENLEEAVKTAYEKTQKGRACVLSPAASSYNEYKNFEEKGRRFKELVRKYGGEK